MYAATAGAWAADPEVGVTYVLHQHPDQGSESDMDDYYYEGFQDDFNANNPFFGMDDPDEDQMV